MLCQQNEQLGVDADEEDTEYATDYLDGTSSSRQYCDSASQTESDGTNKDHGTNKDQSLQVGPSVPSLAYHMYERSRKSELRQKFVNKLMTY